MRRLVDIVVAITGLLLLAPWLIAISLILFFLQGPPIFFLQQRAGRGGQTFPIIKFRTMLPDAAMVSSFDPDNSRRITTIGRPLKAARLDELPQLINLLLGQISLVGPRPLPLEHVRHLDRAVLDALWQARPGLTDPVALDFIAEDQVLAEVDSPETVYLERVLPEKISRQAEYFSHRNGLRDLLVVLDTPRRLWSPTCRLASAALIRQLIADRNA